MWSVFTKEVKFHSVTHSSMLQKTNQDLGKLDFFHKVISCSWQLEQDNVMCCKISEFKVYYTSEKSNIQIA